MWQCNWNRTMAAAGALGALWAAPAALAGEEVGPESARHYVPVVLEKDGQAAAGALDRMVTRVRTELGEKRGPVVVMVHGFAQTPESAAKDFDVAAERLKTEARTAGYPMAVVGVHWDSHAGSLHKWMLQATGARITSLLGMKKAVKNPYLEKTNLAREVGRTGLRSVLFRIEDSFPGAPVHGLAHSLGAEVVVSALAPEGGKKDGELPVVAPERTARLGLVALVGADLDCDRFARKEDLTRMALRRADVWWVTVPKKGAADAVLELRRGAGKPDALGNCGMKLEREDLDLLLRRRALVVDQKDIPATHTLPKYLCPMRADMLASSILYLQDRENPAGQRSVLARLDAVLNGHAEQASGETEDRCVQLYAAWKAQPQKLSRFRFVQVTDPGGESGEARGQALNRSEKAGQPLGLQAAR